MTSRERLCVVHLPSPQEHAWRSALSDAAVAAGWRVIDHFEGHDLPEVSLERILVNTGASSLLRGFDLDEVVIVGGRTARAIEALMLGFSTDWLSSVQYVSKRYSAAAELIRRGASLVNAADDLGTFGGLGTIARSVVSAPTVLEAEDPLAFFDQLPPRKGSSAVWPQSLFLKPEVAANRSRDDLTGRKRMLQYGPYLDLSAGVWEIAVEFILHIGGDATAELRFEWGTGADATSKMFMVDKAGHYRVSLSKSWDEPAASELRVWLDRAMFDGRLEMRSYIVSLIADPPGPAA